MNDEPFWKTKRLEEMSRPEWESLCDGCARCCLIKLEDEETGTIEQTDVACALLDSGACRCTDYENRTVRVPTCVRLTPENLESVYWMPATCAYRRLAEGKDLAWWHPLVSGDPETVHSSGISVKNRVVSEADVAEEDLEDHITFWPDIPIPRTRPKRRQ